MASNQAKSQKPRRRKTGGRQTLYREDFHPRLARWMLARGDATLNEIAKMFGVTTRTLNNWRARYPDFDEACDEPPAMGVERVEASMYQRAIGYDVKVKNTKTSYDTRYQRPVDEATGQFIITGFEQTETIKHVAPDVSAMQFFLTNRAGDRWKTKATHEHTADEGFVDRLERAVRRARDSGKRAAAGEEPAPESVGDK